MGEQKVSTQRDKTEHKQFMQHLFNDVKALELMVQRGMIESGITRIGAEQELALINSSFCPNPIAMEVLGRIGDSHFTTELAKFNLEINLDPQEFTLDAISNMEKQLRDLLAKLRITLAELRGGYILVGILPTISRTDLELKNMSPIPRYFALNDRIMSLRGGTTDFVIQGNDELITKADNIMFESCNTSFQIHYLVDAENFGSAYNWAQAITGPCLACATNSPLLLGRRLWRETRIALFQQATDTRSDSEHIRQQHPRVLFGNEWIHSVTDIFKEDVARFKVLVTQPIEEDSLQALEEGRVPRLQALRLHNGTVYKWNRACYGIGEGKAHLRIESRVLPSGPTVVDEMANMAFWTGLMHGMPKEYKKLSAKAEFDNVKVNFNRAARMGLGAMFRWVNDKTYSSSDLILKELLPIAKEGLERAKIKPADIEKYLGIIQERVETGRTGSQWILDSFNSLKKKGTKNEAMIALTAGMEKRQKIGRPVHKWGKASIGEAGSWINLYWRIDQIMSPDLYTVNEDDLVDLLPNIMSWKKVRHLCVENEKGEFVGLVSAGDLVAHYSTHLGNRDSGVTVGEIMTTQLITVPEDTLTIDAIPLLRKHNIGCLPVLNDENKLVGIVTEKDFVNVADHFLQEFRQRGDFEEK